MSAPASTAPASTASVALYVRPMQGFYTYFAQPLGWLLLRVTVGGLLVVEGWTKIQAPLAMSGFLEGIGFYPGWFWSPLLAVMQFFGGMMIAVGLFTRPVAFANAVMLAITYWFHYTYVYGDAFLTQAGIEALKSSQGLFTPAGVRRLADGGRMFLAQVQKKAEFTSIFWTMAMLLFAAYGGGPLSVDRNILKKEF